MSRALGWSIALWLSVISAGCEKKSHPEPPPSPTAEPVPIGPPPGLLAEFVVAEPQRSFRALRQLVGTPVATLPPSVPMLSVLALGLPAATAQALDGAAPIVGVVLQGAEDAAVEAVIGLRVRGGGDFVARVTTGDGAPYRVENMGPVRHLVRADGGATTTPYPELAVMDSVLVVGRTRGAMASAAPYLSRTLAERARVGSADLTVLLPRESLRLAVSGWLRARWSFARRDLVRAADEERQRRGQPADFADPTSVIMALASSVDSAISTVESLEEVRADLTLGKLARLQVRAVPKAGGAAAAMMREMTQATTRPLLTAPLETRLAAVRHSNSSSRAATASGLAASISGALGPRMKPQEGASFQEALVDAAGAFGAGVLYGALAEPRGATVFLTGTAEVERFRSGVEGLVRALAFPALAEPLSERLGASRVALAPLPKGTPSTDGATFEVTRSRGAEPPAGYWMHTGSDVVLAYGEGARDVLSLLAGSGPSSSSRLSGLTLGADPVVVDVVGALPPIANTALIVRYMSELAPGPAAVAGVAVHRSEDGIEAQIVLSERAAHFGFLTLPSGW